MYSEWKTGKLRYSIKSAFEQPDLVVEPNRRNLQQVEAQDLTWMDLEDLESEAIFADLVENSEAHTLYNGSEIWNNIYMHNIPDIQITQNLTGNSFIFCIVSNTKCLGFKLISGLHAAINMHITHYYTQVHASHSYKNHTSYHERVGAYEDRIKNMYLLYEFVLSAYSKINGELLNYTYTVQNRTYDKAVKNLLKNVNTAFSIQNFHPIDSENEFSDSLKSEIADQLRPHFYNITQLINCVTCEK